MGLIASLLLAACQPTGGASDLRAQFQVNDGLQAFASGCLAPAPTPRSVRAAAENAGIRYVPAGTLDRDFKARLKLRASSQFSFEASVAEDVSPPLFECSVLVRGQWLEDARAFARTALPRAGYRIIRDFLTMEGGPDTSNSRIQEALATSNGREFAIYLVENGPSSRIIAGGNMQQTTIASTALGIAALEQARPSQ